VREDVADVVLDGGFPGRRPAGRADLPAQAGQFAGDPAITPGRILLCNETVKGPGGWRAVFSGVGEVAVRFS
jgi:hypothetical protein